MESRVSGQLPAQALQRQRLLVMSVIVEPGDDARHRLADPVGDDQTARRFAQRRRVARLDLQRRLEGRKGTIGFAARPACLAEPKAQVGTPDAPRGRIGQQRRRRSSLPGQREPLCQPT